MSTICVPSVSSEAEELRAVNSMLVDTFDHCNELKSDILQYSLNPRKDLEEFKEKLVDIAELQKEVSALVTALETVESEMQDKEDIGELNYERIGDIFNEVYLSALEDQYTNEDVEKIISGVDTYVNDPNSGLNVDNDLQVTTTKESYLDPLTKLPIKDPVKSKTCHHRFERSTIVNHLKKNKRCPYTGCVKILSEDDLVEDLDLKRKLLLKQQHGK